MEERDGRVTARVLVYFAKRVAMQYSGQNEGGNADVLCIKQRYAWGNTYVAVWGMSKSNKISPETVVISTWIFAASVHKLSRCACMQQGRCEHPVAGR